MEWEKDLMRFLLIYLLTVMIAFYNDMYKEKEDQKFEKYAWWLIRGGILIGIISVSLFLFNRTGFSTTSQIDTNVFDHFGSFVGGLVGIMFSLAGVLLLIQTLRNQKKDFYTNKTEQRFFELLRIHKENVESIEFAGHTGKKAIEKIVDEILILYNLSDEEDYILRDIGFKIKQSKPGFKKSEHKREYSQHQIINISCLILYFGFDYGKEFILKEYASEYEEEYIDKLLIRCRDKHDGEANQYESNLGTYYRHLYQIVTYIDKLPNKWFSYKEKYEYIKTLRAQFTNKEQVLFFFNSLCIFGRNWEYNHKEENDKLITKYNFIKNIPKKYILEIDVNKYYPNVKYEGEKETEERKKMEENYI